MNFIYIIIIIFCNKFDFTINIFLLLNFTLKLIEF